MVVMPTFTEREDRYEPVVGRRVVRFVWTLAVKMRERVYEPCRVPPDHHPREYAPDDHRPTADQKQHNARDDDGQKEKTRDESVTGIFKKVGDVAFKRCLIVILSPAPQNPSNLRPEKSRTGRMWVVVCFSELMMDAMRRDPLVWGVLDGHRSQDREQIFQPLRNRKAPVGEKPVPPEAYAKAPDDPIEDQ